jgi:hypothetical protein
VAFCLCTWLINAEGFSSNGGKTNWEVFCHCMQHHLVLSSFGW